MNKPGQHTAMISSTALDLPEHTIQARDACLSEELFPIWMKHLPARDANGIHVSLEMVDKADIYIGIYAWRYGWVPDFDNPDQISITEMEFNRALNRKERGELRELLIFLMDDEHPIRASDKEDGEEAQRKLKEFKQRASNGRVVSMFKSKEELKAQIVQALAAFKARSHESQSAIPQVVTTSDPGQKLIPTPPAFYAEPDYIGSHQFVGRETQLKTLSDWALPTNDKSLLLFEAIGGNGKSMLTWEWTTNYSTTVRPDWAGRFWYSFYERGAIMQDFCQRALAYMTDRPLGELKKRKTAEMQDELIALLHTRPWLIILDGLERVLVAYHRIDAAEVPDEEANTPTDKVLNRNPCDAIRDEDNDLLRALARCAPSKILVSTRLIPRVLLNQAGLPIPGVHPAVLPGLDEADAEKLLRSCQITGSSSAIRYYLTTSCGNHPLVIGVLAGLINDYLPNRGNFDAWSVAADGGAALDLGSLDLVQRRNHILLAALDALPPTSRQLLSTLALLSESVDYETLKGFDPNEPPDQKKLAATVKDLERRGLLQYDGHEKRHDLHPVVRGVAAGGMNVEDRDRYGQRVVDYFSAKSHVPYENVTTLEDLESVWTVIRTLIKVGRLQEACDKDKGLFGATLATNLEAFAEIIALLKPYFPNGWTAVPTSVAVQDQPYLSTYAAVALDSLGYHDEALGALSSAINGYLSASNWGEVSARILCVVSTLIHSGELSKAFRIHSFIGEVSEAHGDMEGIFIGRITNFTLMCHIGAWEAASSMWNLVEPYKHLTHTFRPGWRGAQLAFVRSMFWQGTLDEDHFKAALHVQNNESRANIRELHGLRGAWRLDQHDWPQAAASFQEAVRMARERRLVDEASETGLALAKFRLGQLTGDDARSEAERLAQLRQPAHRTLALLWLAIGDHDQAKHHALAAYRRAWADGEPYVNRYELTKTTELLQQMNVPVPDLPPYNPATDEPFPWEADVLAAIKKLRTEKEAQKANDE